MIWKVLKTNIKVPQLTAAFIGVLCGLSLLMGAILFYVDVRGIFTDREGFWKDEYVVINKNVHLSDSYHQIREGDIQANVFSKEEIEALKSQDFVIEVAPFLASTFPVSVHTDRQSAMPGFYSDLFFEAIPDEYLDVNYEKWYWEEGMKFVPLILPRTYLNLYNFGFAQSQNLPQLSEDGIGILELKITVKGKNEREYFDSRIVGFSDRLNTFLVPMSFVEWGNKHFGTDEDPDPGRMIVITNDPSNQNMLDYFEERQYKVDTNLFSNTRALAFLKITSAIVLSIGVIIIALAFWLMIVSLLLLLERNHENISKLGMLGYMMKEIARPYTILIIAILLATYTVSFIPLIIFRSTYSDVISSIGYDITNQNLLIVVIPAFIVISALSTYLIFYMRRQIKKILTA